MTIKAIDNYLEYGAPTADDRKILNRIQARHEAHENFVAGFDDRMNQAFLRIERVAKAEPTRLFGQNTPSCAFNRVIISRGVDDENGERIPGESLLTALISEESLSRMMLSTNREDNNVGLTLETALGEKLPPVTSFGRQTSDDLLENSIAESNAEKINKFKDLQARINKIDKKINRKTKEDLLGILAFLRPGDSDSDFLLRRHVENLSKDLVEYQTEAANAALNISDIIKDGERLKLLQGSEPDDCDITDPELARCNNPILDCAMEFYRPEEARIYRQAILFDLQDKLRKLFPDGIPLDVQVDDYHGKKMDNVLDRESIEPKTGKAMIEQAGLAADLNSEHQNRTRGLADGIGLTGMISRVRGGNVKDLHSSVPNAGDAYFTFRLSVGIQQTDFGNERIRQGGTIVELGLSGEDLMTAFRGTPDGKPVPCSLDHIVGRDIPRILREDEISRILDENKPGDDMVSGVRERDDLEDALYAATDIIRNGVSTMAQRQDLRDVLVQMEGALNKVIANENENISNRADLLTQEVESRARSSMDSINDYIRDKHGIDLSDFRSDRLVESSNDESLDR